MVDSGLEQLAEYFVEKEGLLEQTYAESKLPHSPDEQRIKFLLMDCLEEHYGSLQAAVIRVPQIDQVLNDLAAIIDRYGEKS